jgi:hypothetical protein
MCTPRLLNVRLNVRPSPQDARDYHFRPLFTVSEIPDTLDLRKSLLPVRDQGAQGACFACSCAVMKEYQDATTVPLSAQYFYNQRTNLFDQDPTNDEGMFPRDALKVLRTQGMCLQNTYPYGSTHSIPTHAHEEARAHRIGSFVRVNTVHELRRSLFYHGPAIICFPVYNYTKQLWRPNIEGEHRGGGHAMVVVGYDSDGFHVQNSWGPQWADNGYTYYPLTDWGSHFECWSVVDSDTDDVLKPEDNIHEDTQPHDEHTDEHTDGQWTCPAGCCIM